MAKKDTLADIKAATGTDVPESLNQKQLDELLVLAKGGEGKRAEFDAKLAEYTTPAEEDAGPQIRVKVNPDKGSGSYLHPESKAAIERGGQSVSLPDDAWTQDMIAKRFLLEVRK